MIDEIKKKERVRRYQESHRKELAEASRRYREKHPEEAKASSRKHYAANKEKFAARHRTWVLRKKYGMSEKEYLEMIESQEGRCAVCGVEANLVIDHNHTTNEVRELLCNQCNAMLGMSHDNPITLRKAADYLEKHDA